MDRQKKEALKKPAHPFPVPGDERFEGLTSDQRDLFSRVTDLLSDQQVLAREFFWGKIAELELVLERDEATTNEVQMYEVLCQLVNSSAKLTITQSSAIGIMMAHLALEPRFVSPLGYATDYLRLMQIATYVNSCR